MDLTCSEVYGVNPVVQRNATAQIQGILELVQGENIVKKSDLTIDAFQFVVTASTNAFNAVKLGNASSVIDLVVFGGYEGTARAVTTYNGFSYSLDDITDTLIIVEKDGTTKGIGKANRLTTYSQNGGVANNNIFGYTRSTYQGELSEITTLEPTGIKDAHIDGHVTFGLKKMVTLRIKARS